MMLRGEIEVAEQFQRSQEGVALTRERAVGRTRYT